VKKITVTIISDEDNLDEDGNPSLKIRGGIFECTPADVGELLAKFLLEKGLNEDSTLSVQEIEQIAENFQKTLVSNFRQQAFGEMEDLF